MPAFVKLLGMKWVPCGAHLMNLVVNSGLKLVANLIDRASYLVQKAEILAEIELFYLFPFQRRWRTWFPEVM